MLVRFNKRTIVQGTIYSPDDGEVDLANDIAEQVVAEGNGDVVGLGGYADEVISRVYMSGVASSVTGTAVETTLATLTIPAGFIGANGQVEIITAWSFTNSANNKVLKVTFGGVSVLQTTVTTVATQQTYNRIANRNSEASQVEFSQYSTQGWANTATAINTMTVNTASAVTINFTGTLVNTGETITLESYLVRVIRGV